MMATVEEWRHDVRWQIDGPLYGYDGIGDYRNLHATVIQTPHNGKRAWKVEVLEEVAGDKAEAYTYGETRPLTFKMAKEIATRFVAGRMIPKRLEWR